MIAKSNLVSLSLLGNNNKNGNLFIFRLFFNGTVVWDFLFLNLSCIGTTYIGPSSTAPNYFEFANISAKSWPKSPLFRDKNLGRMDYIPAYEKQSLKISRFCPFNIKFIHKSTRLGFPNCCMVFIDREPPVQSGSVGRNRTGICQHTGGTRTGFELSRTPESFA